MVSPAVGDHRNGAAYKLALCDPLEDGINRHALDYNGVRVIGYGMAEDILLLDNVGTHQAHNRRFPSIRQDNSGQSARDLGHGLASASPQSCSDQPCDAGFSPCAVNVDPDWNGLHIALVPPVLEYPVQNKQHRCQD